MCDAKVLPSTAAYWRIIFQSCNIAHNITQPYKHDDNCTHSQYIAELKVLLSSVGEADGRGNIVPAVSCSCSPGIEASDRRRLCRLLSIVAQATKRQTISC